MPILGYGVYQTPPEDTESKSQSVTEKTTEASQASAENVSADN